MSGKRVQLSESVTRKGRVISLCDLTGNAVRPWADSGYSCICVDIKHSIRRPRQEGNITYVWGDVRSWCPPDDGIPTIFLMAWPPCNDLSVSGARDFEVKGGYLLADALQLFDSCKMAAVYSGVPYLIENPVGRLSSHRRKPDYYWHPWEYAGYLADPQKENTSKKTGLWTGGGFRMPTSKPTPEPHRQDCWLALPADDRADIRSATPMGFARAVYLANAPHLRKMKNGQN